jgi:hypothetical protein
LTHFGQERGFARNGGRLRGEFMRENKFAAHGSLSEKVISRQNAGGDKPRPCENNTNFRF